MHFVVNSTASFTSGNCLSWEEDHGGRGVLKLYLGAARTLSFTRISSRLSSQFRSSIYHFSNLRVSIKPLRICITRRCLCRRSIYYDVSGPHPGSFMRIPFMHDDAEFWVVECYWSVTRQVHSPIILAKSLLNLCLLLCRWILSCIWYLKRFSDIDRARPGLLLSAYACHLA